MTTLTPLTTVEFADHAQGRPSQRTIECALCGKPVFEAAVVTGKLECDESGNLGIPGQWYRSRHLYCDRCDHVMFWLQVSGSDGCLYNVPYVGPAYIRDRRFINAFLHAHPDAAGVIQT